MSLLIAIRNLFERWARFIMSVGGVSLAMLLVLSLDGIFAGSMEQVTAYIDETPFDLIVSQKGVKNLHMTTSFFSGTKVQEIKSIEGVEDVAPILYATDFLVSGNNRSIAYVIGFERGKTGGPWIIANGTSKLRTDEIVIDEQIARKDNLKLGDRITVLGNSFKIGGFTRGTVSIVNSIAFIRYQDFERLRGLRGIVSYAFVKVKSGAGVQNVMNRINRQVKGVTVLTKEEFANSERKVISDMSVDIVRIMNLMGFVIGLAALGLTVYTSTLFKIKEYGILKALGTKNKRLFGIVVWQTIMSVAIGLVLSLLLVYSLIIFLMLLGSNILITVTGLSILKVLIASTVIGTIASSIPIARIANIKPAEVFRH